MEAFKGAQIIYRISEETEYGRYSDSLYYSLDDWAKLTQEELDAAIKQRVNGWIKAITTPPEPYIPTKEDLEAEVARVEMQKVDAENRLAEAFPPKGIEELTDVEVVAEKVKLEEQMMALQAKISNMDMALESISVAKLAVKEEPIAALKG
jgi:hypothetical protein